MNPAIIIIIAFPVFFISLWLFVTFILSRIGWAKLLPYYEHLSPRFDGDAIGTAGGRINGVNYNGVLEFKANHHGIHVIPIKIFSFHHKPLMIPWSDIRSGKSTDLMFAKYTSLIVIRDDKKMASFRFSEKQMASIRKWL